MKPSPKAINPAPAYKPNPLVIVLATIINLGMLTIPLVLRGALPLVWQDLSILIFLSLITVWVILESSAAQTTQNPATPATRLPNVIGGMILFVFWLSLSERLQNTSANVFTPSLGLGALFGAPLIILGVWLRVSAIRTLGSFFFTYVALLPEHPLITGGIYNRLRHPSEAGTLAITLGSTLLLGTWIALLFAAILLLPTILYRINKEDRLLRHHHPLVFNAYSKRVNQLFPFP